MKCHRYRCSSDISIRTILNYRYNICDTCFDELQKEFHSWLKKDVCLDEIPDFIFQFMELSKVIDSKDNDLFYQEFEILTKE